MVKTYSSIDEIIREFRTLHILYFLNAGLSIIVLLALIYLGVYFADGMLKEAILYTGVVLFLGYCSYCLYRHVKIWKNSRVAVKSIRFSEEPVGLVKNSPAF